MSWGTPEGFTGFVVRDPGHVDAETAYLPSLASRLGRAQTRILTLASGVGSFPPDRTVPGNLLALEGVRRAFDLIALGQNLRTFRAPWSQALYWYLNELLRDDGRLVIPVVEDQRAERDGTWGRRDVERLFDQTGESVDSHHLELRRSPSLQRPSSLLPWFISDVAGIVHALLVARYNTAALRAQLFDPTALEMLTSEPPRPRWRRTAVRGEAWFDSAEAGQDRPAILLSAECARLLRSATYLITGLAHKVAALRRAIQTFGRAGPHSAVDIGGAFGFVCGELLLDRELDVREAVTVEYDAVYVPGALRMYRALLPQFRHRFRFALGPAQDYPFDTPATVASLFSSLLYIPRERRQSVMDRCWDSLRPGGVLVIYEALRSIPPVKDDAIQYTAAELDGVLCRYGPVHRIGATALRELSTQEAGETSVFRVVVKPG